MNESDNKPRIAGGEEEITAQSKDYQPNDGANGLEPAADEGWLSRILRNIGSANLICVS